MYKYFAAFIYVTQTEHDAVMRMYDWGETRFEGDDQLYYTASITINGENRLLCAARQDEMGMTASATLSMKLAYHFTPCYLIMPGVAAGTEADQGDSSSQVYGDVLLAEAVWNYSNGKYVPPEESDIKFGTVGFLPRPTLVKMDKDLTPILEKAAKHSDNECHVHFGYLASGSAVVANKEVVEKQIHSQYVTTTGLDMESYGVEYAANHSISPRPYAIIAKSICDFANSRKDDKYQKFAAYTSCEFVKFLCEKILPFLNK